MKKLMCDFCDSIRLGAKVGYREFKDTFNSARQVHQIARATRNGKSVYSSLDSVENQQVKKIRDLAVANYKEGEFRTKEEGYYDPVDGIQKTFREMNK